MLPEIKPIPLEIKRGPAEHVRRLQVINAAWKHFGDHGYEKTSVAALAKDIGVSSTYLYRFFDSKQSIGEAVCSEALAQIAKKLIAVQKGTGSSFQKIRDVFQTLLTNGYTMFLKDRQMHELVAIAISHNWECVQNHREVIRSVLQSIIEQGRHAQAFERKTPIDEVVKGLFVAITPFANPLLLQQRNLEELEDAARAMSGLVLRSLAP